MKVGAIGEAMVELSMDGPTAAKVGVAGDTLNTAIYLKRSAPGIEVDYITRLGTDQFSDQIEKFIRSEWIGTANIERDPERMPGLYAITTDDAGERSFSYWRDSSAARRMFATDNGADFSGLEGYDVLYLSGITLAIMSPGIRTALMRFLQGFRQRGGRVCYDSNYRPQLWIDRETAMAANAAIWALTDIAVPSIDDEEALTGEDANTIAMRFRMMERTGALKRGPSGPLCLKTGAEGTFAPAETVVDTTAAGDSFNGGYLGALLTGASQAAALKAGHDLAAKVIGHKGAILPR